MIHCNPLLGESLLDLSKAKCEAHPNPGGCRSMVDEVSEESWTIPKGFDPTKSWVQITLPTKKYLCRLVVLKQFQGQLCILKLNYIQYHGSIILFCLFAKGMTSKVSLFFLFSFVSYFFHRISN